MTITAISAATAREAVHIFLLKRLESLRERGRIVVKGGVNLRLFFGSPRYSEDIDFDGEPSASVAIKDAICGMFEDRTTIQELRKLGIRSLDPGEGPNKDTETTYRHKFGVVTGGDVRYPTKVEVSFRGRYDGDEILTSQPSPDVVSPYLGENFSLVLSHYGRNAAVRQKVLALAGRQFVQARDVYDLNVLAPSGQALEAVRFLAHTVDDEILQRAHDRALEISYDEYRGQVVEFLPESVRADHELNMVWDEMRLTAATLVEAAISLRRDQ